MHLSHESYMFQYTCCPWFELSLNCISNDSPTSPANRVAWERQSETWIACLASVLHTCTSANDANGTSASNSTTAGLRQIQQSFCFNLQQRNHVYPLCRQRLVCNASVSCLTSSCAGMSFISQARGDACDCISIRPFGLIQIIRLYFQSSTHH